MMGEGSGWDPAGTAKDTEGPQMRAHTRVMGGSLKSEMSGALQTHGSPAGVQSVMHSQGPAPLAAFWGRVAQEISRHLHSRDLRHCGEVLTCEGLTAAQSTGGPQTRLTPGSLLMGSLRATSTLVTVTGGQDVTLPHPDRLSKGRQDAPPHHRQLDCTKHLKKKLVCYGGEEKN